MPRRKGPKMSTLMLDAVSIGPASRYAREKQITLLATNIEELAALRLSIVLTAKWEASGTETPERRAELQTDLRHLRRRYFEKIDDIAMTFGVQKAMKAKEEVERTVTVPNGARAPLMPQETGELYF